MNTVFINGDYVDATEARISVFDLGFLFGDAVYEVLPVYGGQPINKSYDELIRKNNG